MSDEKKASQNPVVRKSRTTTAAILYRNAVPSSSPGLPGTGYPGMKRHPLINPIGVASSSGIAAPPGTQPRWGKIRGLAHFQGRRDAPTLRSVTESPWDKCYYRNAVPPHSPGLPGTGYHGMKRHPLINPIGVASPSEIDAPPRTQPRWGKIAVRPHNQGRRNTPTLRSVMESPWDMEIGGMP